MRGDLRSHGMNPRILKTLAVLAPLWLALNLVAGLWVLPPLLLGAPMPQRTEAQREAIRARLCPPEARWERSEVPGGEGLALEVWRLRRPQSRGVAILLHGFGDDAWGSAGWVESLPDWDGVAFTFRGRDRQPVAPCTLGAWERKDVAAVVAWLEAQGTPRSRMLIVASSMGAGTALLALADLEPTGGPLGGALLECPFRDLQDAARNHLRGPLGPLELLLRPAEALALRRAGRHANFDPDTVSPLRNAPGLRTPIALLTGDADRVTPVAGVRAISKHHPDLTVVPGAGHCESAVKVPGGWKAWARARLERWGLGR